MNNVAQSFIAESRRLLVKDHLPRIERCLQQLTDEQIWWRPNPDSNSIGNLVLHLSGNIRQWIVSGVGGSPDVRERRKEFDKQGGMSRAELTGLLKSTIDQADAVLTRLDLETLGDHRKVQGQEVTVMEAIYHSVEHFSMHTGQIILLTKMITGEDMKFYDFSGGLPRKTW